MTNTSKASVWDAIWQPWSGIHAITGSASLDARFPGQWFQAETGLHYNWHRSYDPTLGRYTQPDPLGFVDGLSVYAYAGGSPLNWIDPEGLMSLPQSKPSTRPEITQCGINDWITACIEDAKKVPGKIQKNWKAIVLACMSAATNKRLPPPPTRPTPPPISRPSDPSK